MNILSLRVLRLERNQLQRKAPSGWMLLWIFSSATTVPPGLRRSLVHFALTKAKNSCLSGLPLVVVMTNWSGTFVPVLFLAEEKQLRTKKKREC